jgi:hypothetical protein
MSTDKNVGTEVTLMDGTKLSVRPLKVSLLRPFMKQFESVANVADDNEKSIDILIECVKIAMQQYNPELAKNPENLEEILDLPTVYKIVEGASGIKLTAASELMNSVIANN